MHERVPVYIDEERLDYILAELKKGRGAIEILDDLPPLIKDNSKHPVNKKDLGMLSEKRVFDALHDHPLVVDIFMDDQPGYDGLIQLDREICTLPAVPLQVKSSKGRIIQYYNSHIYEWVRQNIGEPVVLNGRSSFANIRKNFETQLTNIGALTNAS